LETSSQIITARQEANLMASNDN